MERRIDLTKKRVTPLLKEIAYEKIKESIIEERFTSGSFLSERELIDLLQMSKTPIKAALTRLEAEGFVTVSSKQGIIINELSINQIIDIYDLRIALETYNCKQICGKLTKVQCMELESNIDKLKDIVKDLDVSRFTEVDHEFHLLISSYTGNKEIYRVLLNYQDHLKRITLRHMHKDPYRMETFLEEHCLIYDALKGGNMQCIQYMENHLQDAKRKLFI